MQAIKGSQISVQYQLAQFKLPPQKEASIQNSKP